MSMPSKHHLDHPHHPTNQPAHNPDTKDQAAQVIRGQIDAIYQQSPPHQDPEDVHEPYNHTMGAGGYDLQQYHTAWQQYYQQYYQRYYLQQVHIQRQQASHKAHHAAQPNQQHSQQPQIITGSDHLPESKSPVSTLKDNLLHTVKDRAKKARRSNHFVPIASALAVGLVFLFLQYNRFLFAEVNAYVSPGSAVNESDTVLVDPTANLNVGSEPKVIIPKINVNIRTVYDVTSLEDGPVQEGLKRGVVHYKLPGANSLPGQVGNSVILGHSSNDIFDPGDYKFAFVLLEKLQAGDVFYAHYEGTRYIYRVTEKKIIKPSDISTLQVKTDKPLMTLVTCTPLGTATNRLLVTGEQISPDPATARQPGSGDASDKSLQLPGNSPTLLERVRDFFF